MHLMPSLSSHPLQLNLCTNQVASPACPPHPRHTTKLHGIDHSSKQGLLPCLAASSPFTSSSIDNAGHSCVSSSYQRICVTSTCKNASSSPPHSTSPGRNTNTMSDGRWRRRDASICCSSHGSAQPHQHTSLITSNRKRPQQHANELDRPGFKISMSNLSSGSVHRKQSHQHTKVIMNSSSGGDVSGKGPLADVLQDMAKQLQALAEEQARAEHAAQEAAGAGALSVRDLTFHPPGSEAPLIKNISMDVPPNRLGLIIGRSGSGKTTLLQVLAGLCEQTSGEVSITPGSHPNPSSAPPLSLEARMDKVGLVFQFPERHFLGSDIFSELTFSWPRDPAFFLQQQVLRARVEKVLRAVRLESIPMARSPWALSGGQQRRLALAIQLIRQPALLLLDEPLAGLDWEARMEVVELLQRLKQECTLLVVSHDLREVAPLVDCAWNMKLGGTMELVDWPPPGGVEGLTFPAAFSVQRPV